MKTKLFIIASCTLLLLAAGCKNDKNNEPGTLSSNVSRPTWTAPAEHDMTSSMTAVIRIDLAAQYPDKAADFVLSDNDLLAAFIGDNCVGVASPDKQTGLFFLYISEISENSEYSESSEKQVSLRYYSAHYKNIFVAADAFTFQNDAHLGTISEPLVPTLVEGER